MPKHATQINLDLARDDWQKKMKNFTEFCKEKAADSAIVYDDSNRIDWVEFYNVFEAYEKLSDTKTDRIFHLNQELSRLSREVHLKEQAAIRAHNAIVVHATWIMLATFVFMVCIGFLTFVSPVVWTLFYALALFLCLGNMLIAAKDV